jgi:hypothetical protein
MTHQIDDATQDGLEEQASAEQNGNTATEGILGPAPLADVRTRPDAVLADELMQLLHIDRPTFYRWQKAGKFRRLEIHLGEGVRRRYSRKLVMALLDGELIVRRAG